MATVCIGPGGYDKGVSLLRSHHNGDMAKVAADIFAHYYISGRNSLAVKLIVSERERVGVRGREEIWRNEGDLFSITFRYSQRTPNLLRNLCLVQDALKTEESYNMKEDLKVTLSQLASLSYHKNSKVALAARQVGVAYCYHGNVVLFTVAMVMMYCLLLPW